MKAKLTKRTVDSAAPGVRDRFLWDTELPGYGCKITPAGARIFILQYSANGRVRRLRIGRFGSELTVDEARLKARTLRGLVANGADPAAARDQARAKPTLTEFAERYMAEHAAVKKKPSSGQADARSLRNHVLPALGTLRIDRITRSDISRFHAAMSAKPVMANRCLALLSKMFKLAEMWGVRPTGANPARDIQKYRERKIDRFLSRAELARLGGVLEQAGVDGTHPSIVAAIRLLLFTGCRRNEILTLKWAHVDFERGCLRLPDSKGGAKVVVAGAPALDLLAVLPRVPSNPYVLPGRAPKMHFVGIEKAWQRLRAQADLPDVRLHDLRHSFASMAVGEGESLVMVGAHLGHRQAATTQRYAHMSNDPVRASADRISGHLVAALAGRSGDRKPNRGGD